MRRVETVIRGKVRWLKSKLFWLGDIMVRRGKLKKGWSVKCRYHLDMLWTPVNFTTGRKNTHDSCYSIQNILLRLIKPVESKLHYTTEVMYLCNIHLISHRAFLTHGHLTLTLVCAFHLLRMQSHIYHSLWVKKSILTTFLTPLSFFSSECH